MTESYFMLGHSLGSYLVRRKLGREQRPPQHWQQDCPLSSTSCSQARQKMSFGCFQCSEISVSGTCPTSGSDINTWKQDPTKYAKAVTYEGTPRCSVIRAGKRRENETYIMRSRLTSSHNNYNFALSRIQLPFFRLWTNIPPGDCGREHV